MFRLLRSKARYINLLIMVDEKTEPRTYRIRTRFLRIGFFFFVFMVCLMLVSLIYYYSNAYKIVYYDMIENKYRQLVEDNQRIRLIEREYKKVRQENEKIRMVFGYLKNAPEDTTEQPVKKSAATRNKQSDLIIAEGVKGAVLRGSMASSDFGRSAYQDFISSYAAIPSVIPVESPYISRFFSDTVWSYHPAVDFVAARGTPVRATADGWVLMAEWSVSNGHTIILYHGYGYFSVYKHCEYMFVKASQSVKSGDIIATVGESGMNASGTHLHFEIWKDGEPVDPLRLFPELKNSASAGYTAASM